MHAFQPAETVVVHGAGRYNAWPMIQAVGHRLVCVYSRGSEHTVDEGARGVFSRVSDDLGATWSDEVCVCNDPEWGQVTVGKGLDPTGAMLLWVRNCPDGQGWGPGTHHDLWRTTDGISWEKVSSPPLSPNPIQITDIFTVAGPKSNVEGQELELELKTRNSQLSTLMCFWFSGTYAPEAADKSWGVLTSADGGRTWTQRTVESGLTRAEWPTEPCGVLLGDGRILVVARSEGAPYQFQITSEDGGATWKRAKTNIVDVSASTPSLIFDSESGRVFNYYYHRGARLLKRRVADAAGIFANPTGWLEPEVLAEGFEERPWDAGNVNVTALGNKHFAATYTGTKTDTAVVVVSAPTASSVVHKGNVTIYALPVWPVGEADTENAFFSFRCRFTAKAGDAVTLRATAAYDYKAWLNGEFSGFGPVRCSPGFFRVDEWTLRAKEGENILEIQVAGYNCENFYLPVQRPFLMAEVAVGGKVVAATGSTGFEAFLTSKVRKVPRFSYQRTYSEAYHLPGVQGAPLKVECLTPVKLLPREWDYPDFGIVGSTLLSRIRTRRNPDASLVVPRFIDGCEGNSRFFPVDDLEENPYFEMQRHNVVEHGEYVTEADGLCQLGDCEGAVYTLDRVRSGFIGLHVRVESPTTIYVVFDEILDGAGDVDFDRNGTTGTVMWRLDEPGEYALESFEPYGCKYMRVLSVGGEAGVAPPFMRTYESPSAMRAKFRSSDPALEKIFEAAKASYVANAVDCLTDCPTRERAGWLGDTFFTGRASRWLTGSARNERLFLGNFAMAESFDGPKSQDGFVPGLWPCDLMDANCSVMPTYDMWLIGELEECVRGGGGKTLAESFCPKVMGILESLRKYRNGDGLLQSLPGWVFIEWSEANNLVQDVNYPANMLYALALDAAARLYERPDLSEEAAAIRETVRRQSFNGEWFCDNAVLSRETGQLELSGHHTEACQYFAFFTGTATPESHPGLYRKLLDEFGPNREKQGLYPDVPPANFLFGTLLRMEILSREGRSRQIYDEIRDYLLYMAERTGTLWENLQPSASCCHGFSSIAAEYLFRDILGVRHIDYKGRRVTFSPPNDMPLDWCEGVVPLAEDAVAQIKWRRSKDGVVSTECKLPDGWTVTYEALR